MGKPYQSELDRLGDTYNWALTAQVEALENFVEGASGAPLVVVGSGGSSTAAHLAALLHEVTGGLAKAVTPLEFSATRGAVRAASVLLISAGGRNNDILAAFQHAAAAEPRRLLALSMQPRSPLARLAAEYRYARFVGLDPPVGKDGFLATNSLLAFLVLLTRAYGHCPDYGLPPVLPNASAEWKDCEPILQRPTWVVLHGGWSSPAAFDLESKLTEAALRCALLSDYRNFGHGRHHWLAKRGGETGVLALVTPPERDLARRTLRLLPPEIPTVTLETDRNGAVGTMELVTKVFHLVGAAGRAVGIDPGRPGVPAFGSRLYHLKAKQPVRTMAAADVAIRRKVDVDALAPSFGPEPWANSLASQQTRLRAVTFRAVVFDYDGTLCDGMERFAGPPPEVGTELLRLLDGGAVVGIATGRGGSVRTDLQRVLPERYWEKVLVGYYNGSDIARLADDDHPDKSSPMDPILASIRDRLAADPQFGGLAACEARPRQITVEPLRPSQWRRTRAVLLDILARLSPPGIRLVESSHSIDLLAPGVTKRALVTVCETTTGGETLCIGDRGEWPGNDHDLLSHTYSLSVDKVSPDPHTCWNTSPAGHRGVQATLGHLAALRFEDGGFRYTGGVV